MNNILKEDIYDEYDARRLKPGPVNAAPFSEHNHTTFVSISAMLFDQDICFIDHDGIWNTALCLYRKKKLAASDSSWDARAVDGLYRSSRH